MKRGPNTTAEAAKAFTIVVNFFASVLGVGAAGYALDRWQGTGYRFTLIGVGVGLIIGFYTFFRAALKLSTDSSREDHHDDRSPKA